MRRCSGLPRITALGLGLLLAADIAAGQPSMGYDLFYAECAECHSPEFDQANPVMGGVTAPALAESPAVRQGLLELFIRRIRTGILYGMPRFPHLTNEQLASIYQIVRDYAARRDAGAEPGTTSSVDCEALRERRSRAINSGECTPPPRGDGPSRPGRCSLVLSREELDTYARHCLDHGVEVSGESVPEIQAPGMTAQLPEGREVTTVGRPNQLPPATIGPLAATPTGLSGAELECRAGGELRLELKRPASPGWSSRWTPRPGIEVARRDDIIHRDEHWLALVEARLEPPGATEARAGWCRWTDGRGLGDDSGPDRRIELDLRALPDTLPIGSFVFAPGSPIEAMPIDPRWLGDGTVERAIYDALAAIRRGDGLFRLRVERSDHGPRADGTVVHEHVANDLLGFRPPATPRQSDPE